MLMADWLNIPEYYLAEQQNFPHVLDPPAVTVNQPGAHPLSSAFGEAALDGGEHRAAPDPVAGGNGGYREVVIETRSGGKSRSTVRDDGKEYAKSMMSIAEIY